MPASKCVCSCFSDFIPDIINLREYVFPLAHRKTYHKHDEYLLAYKITFNHCSTSNVICKYTVKLTLCMSGNNNTLHSSERVYYVSTDLCQQWARMIYSRLPLYNLCYCLLSLFDNLAKLFIEISSILMEFTIITNIDDVLEALDLIRQFLGFIEMIRHWFEDVVQIYFIVNRSFIYAFDWILKRHKYLQKIIRCLHPQCSLLLVVYRALIL